MSDYNYMRYRNFCDDETADLPKSPMFKSSSITKRSFHSTKNRMKKGKHYYYVGQSALTGGCATVKCSQKMTLR